MRILIFLLGCLNVISAAAQAPDGYLWIGTWKGLSRFDGSHFDPLPATNLGEGQRSVDEPRFRLSSKLDQLTGIDDGPVGMTHFRCPQTSLGVITDLTATEIGPYAVGLSWSLSDGHANGVELRECADEEPESCKRVALLAADSPQFRYHARAPGIFRVFRMRAFNDHGASADTLLRIDFPIDQALQAATEAWAQRSTAVDTNIGRWFWYDINTSEQWDPINASGWGGRCTNRLELIGQSRDALWVRLAFEGELTLIDGKRVDSYSLHDDDTECDFNRCPARLAFGPYGNTGCYAYLGGLKQISAPTEPRLGHGWPRGMPSKQQLLRMDTQEIVDEYDYCRLTDAELTGLQPPFQLDADSPGHCQDSPLSER